MLNRDLTLGSPQAQALENLRISIDVSDFHGPVFDNNVQLLLQDIRSLAI
jgi:hypothetical protein